MVCDPLGDYNVWGSTTAINNTAKGHKDKLSAVIAAARVSVSRSDKAAAHADVSPLSNIC